MIWHNISDQFDNLTSKNMVSMKTSSRKKLDKIDILTKKNALNWFWILKSHFCDERLWKIIQNVIKKHNWLIAAVTAASSASSSKIAVTSDTVAEIPRPSAASEKSVNHKLKELVENDDWDVKN